jgi:hypothetical protein
MAETGLRGFAQGTTDASTGNPIKTGKHKQTLAQKIRTSGL